MSMNSMQLVTHYFCPSNDKASIAHHSSPQSIQLFGSQENTHCDYWPDNWHQYLWSCYSWWFLKNLVTPWPFVWLHQFKLCTWPSLWPMDICSSQSGGPILRATPSDWLLCYLHLDSPIVIDWSHYLSSSASIRINFTCWGSLLIKLLE